YRCFSPISLGLIMLKKHQRDFYAVSSKKNSGIYCGIDCGLANGYSELPCLSASRFTSKKVRYILVGRDNAMPTATQTALIIMPLTPMASTV
ncbi:MAG: hypothetical protein ACRC47_12050, partial [Shewanella sp.]